MKVTLAIDVGSGVTKVAGPNGQTMFPSLAAAVEDTSTDFEIVASEGWVVRFGSTDYVTGELAMTFAGPKNVVSSQDQEWFTTNGYMALLYTAIAEAFPDGYEGKINLVTGLPNNGYREHAPALRKRLTKTHKFAVNKTKYTVSIRNDQCVIMPQAIGLYLSSTCNEAAYSEIAVGVVDVGSYTSDWSIVEKRHTYEWSKGGNQTGMWSVANDIAARLREEHDFSPAIASVMRAIRKGSIHTGDQLLDIRRLVRSSAFEHGKQLGAHLRDQWDQSPPHRVLVGGGGGGYFIGGLHQYFETAQLVGGNNPCFEVVKGYEIYGKEKWNSLPLKDEAAVQNG